MSHSIHSDVSALPIGTKRFDKGPYFNFYHKEKNKYGVYAERFYPISLNNNLEDMYWHLRTKAVLYDVPEKPIQIEGPDAAKFLDKVFSRTISSMKVNRGRYAIACNNDGGIFIDGVFFRLTENKFWYVQPDGALETWLMAHKNDFNVKVSDPNSRVIQIQGPSSYNILNALTNGAVDESFTYYHSGYFKIADQNVYISRTGWTGEIGYEIYTYDPDTDYKKLWNTLLEIGKPLGLKVDGIQSMEVRRIEAGILDNKTDFDMSVNPYEAGLGALVDLNKPDFIGKKALVTLSKKPGKKLYGIITDKSLKYKAKVFTSNGDSVGYLPLSTWSPTLQKFIGYVRFNHADEWKNFSIKVETDQNKLIDCEITDLPFYDKEKKIPRGIDKTIPQIKNYNQD